MTTPGGDRVTFVLRVEGAGVAQVVTAIAAQDAKGRPFRAILGAQVGKARPVEFQRPYVVDTTMGQGGRDDAR